MGYLAAFNTGSNTSGSLKTGNVDFAYSPVVSSGSFNKIWSDAPVQAAGVTIITDSFTQSLSTAANARPIYYSAKYTPLEPNSTTILNTINKLPERKNQTLFTTAGSALEWINQSGKYLLVNNSVPQIFPSGNVYYIDVEDLSSYPGSGSYWYDISGYKNRGVLINDPSYNVTNNYISFDGTNDSFTSSLDIGVNSTFEFTFKLGTPPVNLYNPLFTIYRYIAGGEPVTEVTKLILSSGSSGNKLWWDDGGITQDTSSNYPFAFNTWYNVALVNNYTTSTASFYINGAFQGYAPAVNTAPTASPIYNDLSLAYGNIATGDYFSKVSFSQFKAYNTTLNSSSVLQNYYGGPIVTDNLSFAIDPGNIVSFENVGGYFQTAYNLVTKIGQYGDESAQLLALSPYTGSFTSPVWPFQQVDPQIIAIPDAFGTTQWPSLGFTSSFSTEIWCNVLGGSPGTKLVVGNQSDWKINVSPASTAAGRTYNLYNFFISGTLMATGSDITGLGTWQHLVGTYSNGTGSLYINGVLQSTSTASIGSVPNNAIWLGLNVNEGVDDTFQGLYGPFRFYQKSLTPTEVRQNFAAFSSQYPNPYTSSILGTSNYPIEFYYSQGSLAGFSRTNCSQYGEGFADPQTGLCIENCYNAGAGFGVSGGSSPLNGLCVPTCPSGYFLDSSNNCVAICPPGTFGDPTTGNCVNRCPDGYYAENSTRLCVTNCDFFFADPISARCVPACPLGTYADTINSRCVETCPSGLYALDAIRACVSANQCSILSQFADPTTNACVDICPYPFFADPASGMCVITCPPGSTPNLATFTCDY